MSAEIPYNIGDNDGMLEVANLGLLNTDSSTNATEENTTQDLNTSRASDASDFSTNSIVEVNKGYDFAPGIAEYVTKVVPKLGKILPEEKAIEFKQLLASFHEKFSGQGLKERLKNGFNAGRYKLCPELFGVICTAIQDAPDESALQVLLEKWTEISHGFTHEISARYVEQKILEIDPEYIKPTSKLLSTTTVSSVNTPLLPDDDEFGDDERDDDEFSGSESDD